MTVRLVALMSVVLLLSLAAFGLMIGLYQDQVMAEVARTASEVGRATLRTFEFGLDGENAKQPAPHGFSWRSNVKLRHAPTDPDPHGAADVLGVPVDVRHTILTGPDGKPVGAAVLCTSTGEGPEEQVDCVRAKGEAIVGITDRLLVDIDEVRAESDPADGLVLKIKTFRPESAAGAPETSVAGLPKTALAGGPEIVTTGGPETAVGGTPPPPGAGTMVYTRHEDIRLPIPIKEYESLFHSVRKRSLWLFLGVFAVGTVLSAGLASRFTRPIRRLDAGIRRLSAGDLDVEVPARGNDEIARLGRAVNDMARSLRRNRQRSREMLRREKHSALGRLAAGVAHDVRNPLHSIGLTLQHLRETCRPETADRADEFDRSIDIIRGEIRRLDRIVGTFLGFAKSEARERGPVDLGELLTETERLVSKEAEWRRVEVSLDLDRTVPPVRADGEAIRSSILNLVLNSFEAMPEGGRLTLGLTRRDGAAVVEVADTGEGISEEDQDRVFDFAFTTKERGNGLGLAMVHQCVVEDHGGRVALESAPQGGTRVQLFLPLGEAEEEVA